jgi:hypothetical protein
MKNKIKHLFADKHQKAVAITAILIIFICAFILVISTHNYFKVAPQPRKTQISKQQSITVTKTNNKNNESDDNENNPNQSIIAYMTGDSYNEPVSETPSPTVNKTIVVAVPTQTIDAAPPATTTDTANEQKPILTLNQQYPDTYPEKWLDIPLDSTVDDWGMYNRESVSYTAWKVNETFGSIPVNWGNATDWPSHAESLNIPTGNCS